MINRRHLLSFGSGLGLFSLLPSDAKSQATGGSRPLKSSFRLQHVFRYPNLKEAASGSPPGGIITSNFNLIAAGNEFKWIRLRPNADTYHFDEADWIMNFVQQHRMLFHGHNLCWNHDNPKWVAETLNKSNAERILSDHVTTIAKRYAGKVSSWDVVNEPIAVFEKRPDGLYPGPWVDALGSRYIDIAFNAAAQADSRALRVLNLHHVEQDSADGDKTREVALDLIRQLMKRNVPIQAIGFESHLEGSLSARSVSRDRFIRSLRDLGLQLLITELDINDTKVDGNLNQRDEKVGQLYYDYITNVVAVGGVKKVILFSVTDSGNWYDAMTAKQFIRSDDMKHRPAILDDNFQPKPALKSVSSALKRICGERT